MRSAGRPGLARWGYPVAAGAALFAVNNLLLARWLTALPGGTMLAAADFVAVALVARTQRRFGAITLIWAAYGALGVLGHMGVDPGAYALRLPIVQARQASPPRGSSPT